ncbi:MAG TPA: DUF3261 domain-containing protein [Aliidongia sp.]|uniref:DUF3261 domain-containing protein n=1 Tax=Aliidongia sp. TaxID=1914230 RepID=UPI002DDD5D3D|nr:DUF3261 domain-containing protein [Aliidongia sp.]HEV2676109.1 DUF3261 domain-containing protein [Aliidongia sp.]
MPTRALVSLLLALLLSACAGPGPSLTSVRIAPDLDLVLPRPGDLGRSLDATQLVSARYGDQAMVFEGHVSVTPERLLLVVVDPLGRRALSVTWTDAGVTYDAAPWLPATVRPENMLADIVVLYWPEAVVRRSLVGGSLTATPGTRSVQVAGHEVIHADYQPAAPGETWAGRAHYVNLPWGYALDIQSVLSAP